MSRIGGTRNENIRKVSMAIATLASQMRESSVAPDSGREAEARQMMKLLASEAEMGLRSESSGSASSASSMVGSGGGGGGGGRKRVSAMKLPATGIVEGTPIERPYLLLEEKKVRRTSLAEVLLSLLYKIYMLILLGISI